MKKLFCIVICALIFTSCAKNPSTSSSDISSQDTNSVSVVEQPSSDEVSEITSSQEEIFEFSIDAKTAVQQFKEELSFTAAMVELDNHFISEKTAISNDMYNDFYAEMSYETADNSLIAVFCCNTANKVERLKQKLSDALNDETKLAYLSSEAKIICTNGYVIFIVTQNNFDEENLVSKLIQ